MAPIGVKYLVAVPLAAAVYFVLVYYLNGWIWSVAPGLEAFQSSLGRLAGTRIWGHSVHAIALLLAGIPSALLLSFVCRPHAVSCAASAGVITLIAAFAPTFANPIARSLLDTASFVHMAVDSVKFVAILMLLAWLAGMLPSNYAMQRSSRVGTPLARTGTGADRLRSASGAPNARRR